MIRWIALVFAALVSQAAIGQSWPERPIRLIVPFPSGGGTDAVARTVADNLSRGLGQTVVVENRPGAGGTIGASAVANSKPDGYTIGLATSSTHPAAKILRNDLPYDPIASFTPVSLIGSTAYVLAASPELKARSLAEFVAYAKAHPGELNFANVGVTTLGYLLSLQFQELTGTKFLHVSYKGSSQVYPDLISGRVSLFLDNPGTSTALINSGKLISYGVSIPTPAIVNVPLISDAGKQQGLANFNPDFWYGIVAPAGTPKTIVDRLQTELARYVNSEAGKKDFALLSLQPIGSTPNAFAERIASDIAHFTKLASTTDVK